MKKQIDLLHQLFDEANRHKDGLTGARFKRVDEYFRGQQSRFTGVQADEDDWKSDTKTNHLYAFYLSAISVLMRDLPMVEVTGRNSIHDELGKQLSKMIMDVFKRNEFPEREEELLYSGFLYGRGFWKVTWDRRLNRGVGDIRIDAVSAKSIIWQPGKTRLRDAQYIFEVQSVDKLSLLTMYPEKSEEIKRIFLKDKTNEITPGVDDNQPMQGSYYDGTGLTNYYAARDGDTKSTDSVPLIECWMLDDTALERFGWIVEANAGNGKLEAVKRKRNFASYPTGRYIRFAGDVILEDKPNPFPYFPYIEYLNMSMDGEEWPMGDLDQLIPIQDIYDTRNNQTTDALNYSITGDRIIADHHAGLTDSTEFTNRPGEIALVGNVEGIKTLAAPKVPGEAFASLSRIQEDFDRISGYPESVLGGNIGDVRSGYAIEQLNELVQGRLKLKTYSLEVAVRELAKCITRMIGLFYTRGEHYSFDLDLVGVHPELFDYQVRAGMNLPASRRSQEQYIMQLYDRGGADEEYLVSQSDIPGKDQLIERMRPLWEAKRNALLNQAQLATTTQQPPNLSVVGGQP